MLVSVFLEKYAQSIQESSLKIWARMMKIKSLKVKEFWAYGTEIVTSWAPDGAKKFWVVTRNETKPGQ